MSDSGFDMEEYKAELDSIVYEVVDKQDVLEIRERREGDDS